MSGTQSTTDHDRTALVTGASRGIGYELAKLFATDGYDVVLVARSQDTLEEVAEELESASSMTATVISKDLSVPGAAEDLYETVTGKDIQVDALVNNAGISIYVYFCETEMERERDVLQLNVTTLTELTKLFARDMCERGGGQILNVSSLAGGGLPTPKFTVYGATKAYVYSFSVALANELAEEDITVTVFFPGSTDTEIVKRGGVENSAVPDGNLHEPQEVAQKAYNGLQQGETIVLSGVKEKLLFELPRIMPKTTTATIARKVTESE